MAIYKNTSPIVTNGLVLNWDAANQAQQVSRNLFNFSNNLTSTAWNKIRCQITASAGTAPDGTNTAFAMTITDASGLVRLAINPAFTASVEGGPYTFSCFVSRSSCTAGILQLGIYNGAGISGVEPDYAIQTNFEQTGSSSNTVRRTIDVGNGCVAVTAIIGMLGSVPNPTSLITPSEWYFNLPSI